MADQRIENLARILVEYSTRVGPGDDVGIFATTAAEPLAAAIYPLVLRNGGHAHLLLDIADQDELFFSHAAEEQIDTVPRLHRLAFDEFDVLIKIRSQTNTRSLSNIDTIRQARRQMALSPLLKAQLSRGAEGSLRWVSTLFPTQAYAMEAEMGFEEYQDFVYRACHADLDTTDPVAYWKKVQREQAQTIERIEGGDQVHLRGPNVDLTLSIKDRIFKNACGLNNMPDGEIYTGPVEDSANGWVRFTYPAVSQGRVVEGVRLTFQDGEVVDAKADSNQDFLLQMLNTDSGARFIGEFAIGTNYQIDHVTRNTLYDEKIGGSFHLALGASYPETGGLNKSAIHWDLICDVKQYSEILVDGQLLYRNGEFL